MSEGSWMRILEGKPYNGTAMCSETEGEFAKAGKDVSPTSGNHCWCKTSYAWVHVYNFDDTPSCFKDCVPACLLHLLNSKFRSELEKDIDAERNEEPETPQEDDEEEQTPEPELKNPKAIARASDGSCLIPHSEKVGYSDKGSDADCTGLDKGEWKVSFDDSAYQGTALCSETPGENSAETGEPSTTSGENCWCKYSDTWVFVDKAVLTQQCVQNCAYLCAFTVYGLGEGSIKFRKALGIE